MELRKIFDVYRDNLTQRIAQIADDVEKLYKEFGIIATKVMRDAIDGALGAWLIGTNQVYMAEDRPWDRLVLAHETNHRLRSQASEQETRRTTSYESMGFYPSPNFYPSYA